ncbi:hypothetical protein TNCV_4986381 [Trichonephila clavipes]|nr:hypothetical protein TNCV_4986381 [Trichonephila clavipes]
MTNHDISGIIKPTDLKFSRYLSWRRDPIQNGVSRKLRLPSGVAEVKEAFYDMTCVIPQLVKERKRRQTRKTPRKFAYSCSDIAVLVVVANPRLSSKAPLI